MFVKILCRRLLEPMPNAGLLGRGAGAVQPWSKVGIGNFAVKNLRTGYQKVNREGNSLIPLLGLNHTVEENELSTGGRIVSGPMGW